MVWGALGRRAVRVCTGFGDSVPQASRRRSAWDRGKLSCQTRDPQLGRDLESVVKPDFWGLLLNFVPEDLGMLGGRSPKPGRGEALALSLLLSGDILASESASTHPEGRV